MEAEIKRLAKRALGGGSLPPPKRADTQTLLYPFDRELAWLAVNYLRTPSRVLWDLYAAQAMRLEPLYDEVFAWVERESRGWLTPNLGISVEVRQSEAFPAGPLQIQGTVKNALIDGARARGIELHLEPAAPDLLVSVRGAPPTIALDLAGGSLHQRGYRLEHGEAPLRENLAAQMLMLARWDPRHEVLIDPMAGSGTLPIEGALMAEGAPLWVGPKKPLAARMPFFRDLAEAPLPTLFPGQPPPIFANELDPKELRVAKKNAARAGVAEQIHFIEGSFHSLDLEALRARLPEGRDLSRGLIICNPPYGERLGHDTDLAELYADLFDFAHAFGAGWRAAFLVANPALERAFGPRPILKKPMSNAQLKANLLVYELGG